MKNVLAVMMCFSILAMSTMAMAADVYVTKSGKKYHTADCPLIKNRETVVMDEKEAKEKGLTPCKKCHGAKKKEKKK